MPIAEVQKFLDIALRAAYLSHIKYVVHENENYVGDDEPKGYIEIEGLVLYACHIEQDAVVGKMNMSGWAVDKIVITPGRHYMPNGDPGYPDEQDSVFVSKSTRYGDMIKVVVGLLVEEAIESAWENEAIEASINEEPQQ